MIVPCCLGCADCSDRSSERGLGWGWDDLNPITFAGDVVNSAVSAVGSVASNVATQVDKTAKTALGTALSASSAARSLVSPQGSGAPAPEVSFTPLLVGGAAAAGLLLLALGKKRKHP